MIKSNRLVEQTSPYLRQHMNNPVDWYPWGPEAFQAAKERNVPILLSVGYSACHWCHVMAHECFEDVEVAAEMNRLFVSVKVDREERPEVDALYMEAVQALIGRGGWPLTAFLTPSGEPFYGGTYFPKPNFLALLTAIDDVWNNRPQDVAQNTSVLMTALRQSANVAPASSLPSHQLLGPALQQLAQRFDADWGGFGSIPKFPSTMNLDLVLRAHQAQPGEGAQTVVTTSLDAMASGGLYDHLGGGFARYSTDREWLTPHFEKMLYDQALLLRLYVHAWLALGKQRWQQVIEETVDYVLRDLTNEEGGWYSAQDADSLDEHGHGREGFFYTWTVPEIEAVLGDDASAAMFWFEVTEDGNFDGRSILSRTRHRGELARPPIIESARQRLLAARSRRNQPELDVKVLTEWNALFLSALAEAAFAFDRPDWLAAAQRNGEFLLRSLRGVDGRWLRSWQADGTPPARHAALASDHANLIDAFTRLGEATGKARWIDEAVNVAEVLLDHFWDTDAGGVFTTADDAETLVVRQKDLADDATPSANSMAASALYRLGALIGEVRYINLADQILQLLSNAMATNPGASGNALSVLDMRHSGLTEVVIPGHQSALLNELRTRWLPNTVRAWGEPYESPLWDARTEGFAYVCRNYTCQLPLTTASELAQALDA